MAADEGAQHEAGAARDDQADVRFVVRRGARQRMRERHPSPVMRHGGRDAGETNDVKGREALWQQRRHFVGIDGDERAC
ncbi:hypothetical protein [Burkholderia ubonensis]|uniref:hypothetical protein n=1 Tax=Burkholderia ubonensis TaxID=101571 RepID=UPI0018DFF4AB|nr:hypothetical protein [Burkholderia ubonensis]